MVYTACTLHSRHPCSPDLCSKRIQAVRQGYYHRNMGLQVNTESLNAFQFCASAYVTMLQLYTSVHIIPIMLDYYIKI